MKATLITILAFLALGLSGCQGIKQAASQPASGTMSPGNWEFVLTKTSTQNIYVESNLLNTSTPGTYDDHGGDSTLFSLDSSVYFADPAAGGGYQFGAAVSSFTLTINSQLGVSGTLSQNGGQVIRFIGMVDASGMTMSGTFDDESGDTAPFTASAVSSLGGFYADASDGIEESLSGNVVSEISQYGSGNYALMPSVGNFALLSSDIPTGDNGTGAFWNNSGACAENECAVWFNASTNAVWVLMNNQNSGTSKVVGVLRPPA